MLRNEALATVDRYTNGCPVADALVNAACSLLGVRRTELDRCRRELRGIARGLGRMFIPSPTGGQRRSRF